jgi:hypothetical protein
VSDHGPQPTEELAAAVVAALLATHGGARPDEPPATADRWAVRERMVRQPLSPGADSWRFSLR